MKAWLKERGVKVASLDKAARSALRETAQTSVVAEALRLYDENSKSSLAKYDAMLRCVCADGRVRGTMQFYGSHTGRWSGQRLQPQNLPQNHLDDLDEARTLAHQEDWAAFEAAHPNATDALSQLIRTAFVPSQGKKFVVADFSSIERLVLAWMAGERWVVEAYARGEDLYLATASRMFGREITDKKAPERAVAKVLDLACGYSGGTGAADKFCEALRVDIPQTRQSELVRTWRDANPHVGLCHKMLDT